MSPWFDSLLFGSHVPRFIWVESARREGTPTPGFAASGKYGPASRISTEPYAAISPAMKPPPDPAPQMITSYVSAMSLLVRSPPAPVSEADLHLGPRE